MLKLVTFNSPVAPTSEEAFTIDKRSFSMDTFDFPPYWANVNSPDVFWSH